MKIGIGSYTYPWNVRAGMTAEQVMDQAIALECNVVQFCDNLDLPKLDWSGLRAKAEGHGIEIQVGSVGGPAELAEVVEIGRKVGSSLVRFVVGQAYVAQSVADVADGFRESARRCQEFGAKLAIENHDFFTTAEIAAIVDAIGENCGACVDTANSLSNLEGTQSLIDNLSRKAICLHAKDVIVEREIHMLGFRIFGVPAGRGFVDFPLLRENMPNLETVILEQWVPTRNGKPALEAEMESAQSGISYLKGLWQ